MLRTAAPVAFFAPVPADALGNGGFEEPALDPGEYVTISPAGEPAKFEWTVTSGNVDVAELPVDPFVDYPAAEGENALDLNGSLRGAISQDFPTVAGKDYVLEFSYSDNPFESGTSTADVLVTDVGSGGTLLSGSVSHSTASNGTAAAGDGFADWQVYVDTFTATGTSTRLAFTSTSPSNSPSGGIILDAVSVTGAEPTVPAMSPSARTILAVVLAASGIAAGIRLRASRGP